ncbi:MAG: Rrf2 family transcriptional regulator, partial [Candidatus Omnitrophota bacterium]|nr:Rrf2 family transcriptional regulator [Candidatus Omnitrophota bacterium]
MFHLYSKGCEYTLRALICGLEMTNGQGFRVEDACRVAEVPESFTRKGFQRLAHQGVLKAVRGPGGGYHLQGSASDISILEIVRLVDGKEIYEHCVMGLSQCGDKAPCPIHKIWKKMKKALMGELSRTSL